MFFKISSTILPTLLIVNLCVCSDQFSIINTHNLFLIIIIIINAVRHSLNRLD